LLFGIEKEIDLNEAIPVPDDLDRGLYKCRITYDENGFGEAAFSPYILKNIKSLKIVRCDDIDYRFKYDERGVINDLLAQRGNCDDILIIKNGYVSDTSVCNIVFFDGDQWVTPATPLLRGTKRAKLIHEGVIYEAVFTEEDLSRFKTFCLINAFRELAGNQILIENIIY